MGRVEEPPDQNYLGPMLDEFEAIHGVLFTEPDAPPVHVIVQVLTDEADGVRLVIGNGQGVQQQLVMRKAELEKRLANPQDPNPPPR